jgi:hypothetical protein
MTFSRRHFLFGSLALPVRDGGTDEAFPCFVRVPGHSRH